MVLREKVEALEMSEDEDDDDVVATVLVACIEGNESGSTSRRPLRRFSIMATRVAC